MASRDISIKEAEKILGLDGAYTYKDVNTAYRKMVAKCHPDVGGDPEEMVRVNKAKDALNKRFVNDKNAIFSTHDPEPSTSPFTQSYTRQSYTRPNSQQSQHRTSSSTRRVETFWNSEDLNNPSGGVAPNGYAPDGFQFPVGWSEKDKCTYCGYAYDPTKDPRSPQYQDTAENRRRWTLAWAAEQYHMQQANQQASETVQWAYDIDPQQVKDFVNGVADVAGQYVGGFFGVNGDYSARIDEQYDDGKRPAWYRFANWMVTKFWWRIAYAFVAVIYGMACVFGGIGNNLFGALGAVFFLFSTPVNFITGWITNPIRKFIRNAADKSLSKWMWAKNRNKQPGWQQEQQRQQSQAQQQYQQVPQRQCQQQPPPPTGQPINMPAPPQPQRYYQPMPDGTIFQQYPPQQ